MNKTSCVLEISEENAVNLAMMYVTDKWGRSVSLPQVANLGIYKNGMTNVIFFVE